MTQDFISQVYDTPELFAKLSDNEKTKLTSEVEAVVSGLDRGETAVVQKQTDGKWLVNASAKKAILLYFRLQKMELIEVGPFHFVDKIPLKKWTGKEGVRVVPHALVRRGAFIESGAILMPSYVNIGARVGSGTMVDTWATVGSCAFIGKNVHLSGGVGIGGVLEPVQASPVIVEDNVFVGSRAILVEGVHIEEGAVIGAGVTITGSTKIIDVSGKSPVVLKGRVPKNSVVIPGTTEKEFPAGKFGVPCALIIGTRKESTNLKTSLTDALRDFDVAT
ncbi:MAG: 2,3,4,5-tetrahydropyridine-2,6-dicarboxylate N-succinyltransferase [Deltaproteobacteria bacterium]|nr:2,3,4,5-tetrahydropyridine-2,6-dicarboxylate N-succinyltransferase [Deltaproteobacteria bacterium]